MPAFRRLSFSLAVTALVFVAEVFTAVAVATLSELNWNRSLLPVTVALALGVMLVAAGLVGQLTAFLARRTVLAGFQTRLDAVELARGVSHCHVATMIPAVAALVGGLDSQRKLIDALRAQLVPAAEKLSGECGAARTARAPLLNALALAGNLGRETDQRRDAARELQIRVGRIDAAHSTILRGLREIQETFDGLPSLGVAPPAAPAAPAGAAITLTEARRLADRVLRSDSPAAHGTPPAPPLDASGDLPPVLKARLAQRPLNFDGDGFDMGTN